MRKRRKYEEFETDDGTLRRYTRHENGGGMVENSATAHATARIAINAYVDPGARVEEDAVIHEGAWIDSGAVVGRGAVIGSGSHVGQQAVIAGGASVGARARVGAGARVAPGVSLPVDFVVSDGETVTSTDRRSWATAA